MKMTLVDFNNVTESLYEDKRAMFKRISTRASAVACDDEPLRTEWIWYWCDEHNQWQVYNTNYVSMHTDVFTKFSGQNSRKSSL